MLVRRPLSVRCGRAFIIVKCLMTLLPVLFLDCLGVNLLFPHYPSCGTGPND